MTLQPFADFADSQIRHGREEVLRLWLELRAPWERLEIVRMNLVDAGDCVVADMLARGVMKGTEDEVDMRVASTNVVRDGKLAGIRYYRKFTEALEAARRLEQTGS